MVSVSATWHSVSPIRQLRNLAHGIVCSEPMVNQMIRFSFVVRIKATTNAEARGGADVMSTRIMEGDQTTQGNHVESRDRERHTSFLLTTSCFILSSLSYS